MDIPGKEDCPAYCLILCVSGLLHMCKTSYTSNASRFGITDFSSTGKATSNFQDICYHSTAEGGTDFKRQDNRIIVSVSGPLSILMQEETEGLCIPRITSHQQYGFHRTETTPTILLSRNKMLVKE